MRKTDEERRKLKDGERILQGCLTALAVHPISRPEDGLLQDYS